MEPLPFDDGRFDFVRIASIGLGGVPEDLWAQLIEEAARVLTPGGHLEVFEHNFAVLRQRPPMQTPNPLRAMPEDDPDAVIDDCFDAVLEQRFINPRMSSTPFSSLSGLADAALFQTLSASFHSSSLSTRRCRAPV